MRQRGGEKNRPRRGEALPAFSLPHCLCGEIPVLHLAHTGAVATAFGALAASRHPGTASKGTLLLLSLGCTLVATLAFVPALLRTLRQEQGPQ